MKILIAVLIIVVIILILAIIKIAYLRRAFDELTENIESQVSGDTHVPITLSTSDSHARKAAELLNGELSRLHEERTRYEDGNRKITSAVTEISHDIRTPLTAVNSYLELLDNEESEELKAAYLQRIKSRVLSLSDMADELFKYSTSAEIKSYTEDNDTYKSTSIDICRVLEECMLSFYAAFTGKGIEPDIKIPDHPVTVLCDSKSANRIFENIISNALKYADGSLKVTLDINGEACFMNRAPNLTPVSAAKLFDRYYTVNEGSSSTGLGFSIAKDMITKCGGNIESRFSDGTLTIAVRFIKAP